MARIDVVMPQMGESIAEGTLSTWLKKVGEEVKRDEPIFEISTDKVDAEIPSPSTGTLVEIRSQEGDTVPVNNVVAVIETEAGAAASAGSGASEPAPDKPAAPVPAPAAIAAAAPAAAAPARSGDRRTFVSPVVRRIAAENGIDPAQVPGTGAGGRVTKKDILAFIESGASTAPAATAVAAPPASAAAPVAAPPPPAGAPSRPAFA